MSGERRMAAGFAVEASRLARCAHRHDLDSTLSRLNEGRGRLASGRFR
jgi:hypothetical protein